MGFSLAPEAAAAGYGLVAHETIGSTNADAMARLRRGERDPVWIVSRQQSAGRGRRGASWISPPGNLHASLALTIDVEPAVAATLGFVAGVALTRALKHCCSAADLSLKWPNDVLAGEAKLAGILLETEVVGEARAVAVGIGANVTQSPEGLPYRTASLAAFGAAVTAEELFGRLSAEWVRAYAEWDRGRGFGAIRAAWLLHAAGLGQPISVALGAERVAGTFETVDEHGRLVLRHPDGTSTTVSAGEVHFGSAASVRREAAA